ncbi:MAG TPA: hypothetical protein DCW58_00450 [Candidatus Pacebacteria bacterium]|nr:hypothetical protein [Candidatus Paceibacterota bacterium]
MSKFFIKIKQVLNKTDKYYFALVILIIIAFFISLEDLRNPMIAEPDAYARFNIAFANYKDGVLYQKYIGTWLPLHFVILSSSFYLKTAYISPRVITLIINLLSIVVIFIYSYLINKDKKTAILASLLYLLLPMRIIMAAQTLSEPVFIFFFITALCFFLKKKPNYLLGILFLNISQGIRFEAWLVLPFIYLLIVLDKKISSVEKIIYLLLSTSFPIYWMINNYLIYGESLFFFNEKNDTAQKYANRNYYNISSSFMAWWRKLKQNVNNVFIVSLLINLLISKKQNKKNQIIAWGLAIYFFIILVAQVYFGTMEWEANRYLLLPIALSLPLVSSSIISIFSWLKNEYKIRIYLIFILFSLGSIFIFNFQQMSIIYKDMNRDVVLNKKDLYDLLDHFNKIKQNKVDKKTSYFYSSKNNLWLDQPFFYFTDNNFSDEKTSSHHYYEKVALNPNLQFGIIVWQKSKDDFYLDLENNFNFLYENDNFLIMEKKLE